MPLHSLTHSLARSLTVRQVAREQLERGHLLAKTWHLQSLTCAAHGPLEPLENSRTFRELASQWHPAATDPQ